MIVEHLRDLAEPISAVHPYPGNPRVGDTEIIKRSLAKHGQFKPIVANRPTGDILAGNHVWQSVCELGWTEVAVVWVEVDEEQAREMVLVDNRAAEMGSFNDDALAELLAEVDAGSLIDVGYSEEDLAELLGSGTAVEDDDEDDFTPFTAYEEFAVQGKSAGASTAAQGLSGNDDAWVNLRLVDLRIRVARPAYTELYERLLRENANDRAKASVALARMLGFTAEQIEAKA